MTDRARTEYVSEIIALFIANEGEFDGDQRIAERAARLAGDGDIPGLRRYVRLIITSGRTLGARQVRDELAANDWDRVDWSRVADELDGLVE